MDRYNFWLIPDPRTIPTPNNNRKIRYVIVEDELHTKGKS